VEESPEVAVETVRFEDAELPEVKVIDEGFRDN